jgi:peptide deformylase
MSSKVLILGNPILKEKSQDVVDFKNRETIQNINDLKQELDVFRKQNGFGRGIAAIQIGIKKRIIALNLDKGSFVIVNPSIVYRSQDTFTLWDDCMSFPELVVKVRRNSSIDIEYQDELGNRQEMKKLGRAESELLQHEIDHLDGILATERAIEVKDIIYKSEYNKNLEYYGSQVDYKISSTIEIDN